jgi:resuscitation-promoting factor RpfB
VTRTITETVRIPFATKNMKDSSLPKGTSKVRTHGVAGAKTVTYQVTLTDGAQTSKKVLRQRITKEPVTQVIAIGTKQTHQCDPNYSGACVPIASDVDCAGGSGNGPAYVQGPVRVIGTDIYDLDRDGDGVGCD